MTAPFAWPWFGLAAAVVILALSFRSGARWRDTGWLAWLGVAIYMLHQFEEHGIDATGRAYAFRGFFCHSLGLDGAGVDACPVPHSFLTAVNVGTVWIASLLSALVGPRHPAVALSAMGIPLVNTLAHVVPAVWRGVYNPGLLTALFLFAPYCLWTMTTSLRSGALTGRQAAGIVAAGVAIHAVLIGSLQMFLRGVIGEFGLVSAQVGNAFLPAAMMFAIGRGDAASQVKSCFGGRVDH